MELEKRKGRRQKGKGEREGYNEKNKSEETKGDLGSGNRMDNDPDKTKTQMAILYVWAYVSVLDLPYAYYRHRPRRHVPGDKGGEIRERLARRNWRERMKDPGLVSRFCKQEECKRAPRLRAKWRTGRRTSEAGEGRNQIVASLP